MNAPDYRRGYLRVPLAIWAALYCHAPLTRRQLQLVSLVIRESWGWRTREGVQEWTRPLSPKQLAEATGLSTDHISRDLRQLLAAGVLRGQGSRYQFVPDVELWITDQLRAPKAQLPAPKETLAGVGNALSTPASKIGKKEERNVVQRPAYQVPGAVDKFARRSPVALLLVNRLADIVSAFVGSLSERHVDALRAWICQDGIAAVWRSLEPSFRISAQAGRSALLTELRCRSTLEGGRRG